MKTVVINYAEGSWYPKGQARLSFSLDAVGYTGDKWMRRGQMFGCFSHEACPYGFKPFLCSEAVIAGYDMLIWCDASMYAQKNIDPFLEIVQKDGFLFVADGNPLWRFISDACLEIMGWTREEVRGAGIPAVSMGCFGLSTNSQEALTFLGEWTRLANLGAFKGPWTNDKGQASSDPNVRGHRHDLSVASLLIHELGLPVQAQGPYMGYYPSNAIFVAKGGI